MAFTPWTAGAKITAAKLAAMTPIWQSWTPTWTTTTGSHTPSLGNATLACTYCQTGDLVVCRFGIQFGSTTNFGSGATASDNWIFSLPVTASNTDQASGFVNGSYDGAGSHDAVFRARLFDTGNVEFQTASGEFDGGALTNSGIVDALSPGTWTTSGHMYGNFFYQAA